MGIGHKMGICRPFPLYPLVLTLPPTSTSLHILYWQNGVMCICQNILGRILLSVGSLYLFLSLFPCSFLTSFPFGCFFIHQFFHCLMLKISVRIPARIKSLIYFFILQNILHIKIKFDGQSQNVGQQREIIFPFVKVLKCISFCPDQNIKTDVDTADIKAPRSRSIISFADCSHDN